MKILQIAPAWIDTPPKGYGGTELIVDMLANGLVEKGHDVTLFATKNSVTNAKLEYAFESCFTDMNIPWSSCLPSLYHFERAFNIADQFDFVHVHLSSDTDIILLPFLAKLKVPHLMTIHGQLPYDKHTFMDKYYMETYGKKINSVSISNSMAKLWPDYFIDYGTVYNAVDSSKYPFNANPQNYFTWVGKIVPWKGTYEAILAAKKANVKFIFAGIVDQNVKESVEYFKNKIEPLIDNDQIKYLGIADVKMKNEMLGNARGFLNPISWEEPFGLVMTESMSCGTPVISNKIGAAPEIIINGSDGFTVESFDEMVERIKEIDNIDRRNVRSKIEEKFSIELMVNNYLNVYDRVIKNTK